MYAHQVIESLKTTKKTTKIFTDNNINNWIQSITDAQKFHMNTIIDIQSLLGSDLIFKGQNGNVRLPYKKTWIDFYMEPHTPEKEAELIRKGKLSQEGDSLVKKRAILAEEVDEATISVKIFNAFEEGYFYKKHFGKHYFEPSIFTYLIYIGGENTSDYGQKGFFVDNKNGNIQPQLAIKEDAFEKILEKEGELLSKRILRQDSQDITQLNIFLILLSCKNISTIDNNAPEKLNKKRKKSFKCPLFTYKTLVIKPTGKSQRAEEVQGLWENRLHLCRGHFKTFTEEKPLFGRVTGRFWWQPSARGNKNKGIVMKDYKITG
jgi:hypothetical protein